MDLQGGDSDVKLNQFETKVYKGHRTLMQMLKDRGYGITDQNLGMTREQYKNIISKQVITDGKGPFSNLDNIYQLNTAINKNPENPLPVAGELEPDYTKVAVIWQVDQEKVNDKTFNNWQMECSKLNVYRMIMIVQGSTTLAKKSETSEIQMVTSEVWQLDDLQVNITYHKMVPEHSVLSDEDKATLMEKYKIKPHQLPKIQKADPIARYFGVKRGDVMKIIRASETAGRYVTYRIVL